MHVMQAPVFFDSIMADCVAFTCENKDASLKHHKSSLRGAVIDFIITFHHNECDIHRIIHIASTLFQSLCNRVGGNGTVKAHLVARVRYLRCSTGEMTTYYHSSGPSEEVMQPVLFSKEHMLKIGSRLDNMNHHGSMLMIQCIEAIHIQLSLF